MTRQIVTNTTTQFIVPTILTGVPLPKSGKGRKAKPLNPALVKMPAGSSFTVTGDDVSKAVIADLARIRKAYPDAKFVTRNLSGQANPTTFETYPAHTLGVWCMAGCDSQIKTVPLSDCTFKAEAE